MSNMAVNFHTTNKKPIKRFQDAPRWFKMAFKMGYDREIDDTMSPISINLHYFWIYTLNLLGPIFLLAFEKALKSIDYTKPTDKIAVLSVSN